jgi:hypothetical protein
LNKRGRTITADTITIGGGGQIIDTGAGSSNKMIIGILI